MESGAPIQSQPDGRIMKSETDDPDCIRQVIGGKPRPPKHIARFIPPSILYQNQSIDRMLN